MAELRASVGYWTQTTLGGMPMETSILMLVIKIQSPRRLTEIKRRNQHPLFTGSRRRNSDTIRGEKVENDEKRRTGRIGEPKYEYMKKRKCG